MLSIVITSAFPEDFLQANIFCDFHTLLIWEVRSDFNDIKGLHDNTKAPIKNATIVFWQLSSLCSLLTPNSWCGCNEVGFDDKLESRVALCKVFCRGCVPSSGLWVTFGVSTKYWGWAKTAGRRRSSGSAHLVTRVSVGRSHSQTLSDFLLLKDLTHLLLLGRSMTREAEENTNIRKNRKFKYVKCGVNLGWNLFDTEDWIKSLNYLHHMFTNFCSI